jgi:hypothetical protein
VGFFYFVANVGERNSQRHVATRRAARDLG